MESPAANGFGVAGPNGSDGNADGALESASGSGARPMNPPVATPFFFYMLAGIMIIGGIMVLFLFVIMLINMERNLKERQFNRQWLVGITAAAALGGLLIAVFTTI